MEFRHRAYQSSCKANKLARRMARMGLYCQVWFDSYTSTYKVDIWRKGALKAQRSFVVAYHPRLDKFMWYAAFSYGVKNI